MNWGILGCGKISHKFATDLLSISGQSLIAVASNNPQKASDFGKKFNVQYVYNDYKNLLQSTNIDIIYIGNTHNMHYETAKLCLEHQKHVICEKPMTLTAADTEELYSIACQKKLFIMEAMWMAFLPLYKHLFVYLLKDKIVGDITSIYADFGFRQEFNLESRLFDKNLGGGALYDIGIYPLYLATLLLGKPIDIQVMANKGPSDVDHDIWLQLKHAQNKASQIFASFSSHSSCTCLINGTNGFVKINHRFHEQESAEIYIHNDKPKFLSFPKKGFGYSHEIKHVVSCIAHGQYESPIVSKALSCAVAEVIDKVYACIL